MNWSYRYGAVLGLGLVLGAWGMHWWQSAPVTVAPNADGIPTATVQRPDLRPQDVAPHVSSPTAVRTVAQQQRQGRTVTAVAETRGTLHSTFPNPECPPVPVEAVAVATTDKAGQPGMVLDLYTVGLFGERIPLPDAQTTLIISQPQHPRWRAGLTVSAGVSSDKAAVIGLRWLTRGRSRAAEDGIWALLSPALVVTAKEARPALLPVSLNVGRVLPVVKDVWVSPVVSLSAGKPAYAVALTASF